VIVSISTLFQASTTEMWIEIMYSGIDATGKGTNPVEHANPAMAILFVVFMIIMTFLVLNLFVGVAVD
jgi:NADH:ubiquinone oxidoreductase subunit 3 (subunit A)